MILYIDEKISNFYTQRFLFIICKELCQLKLKIQNVAKDVQKVCYCFKSFPREFDLHESIMILLIVKILIS